MDQIEQRVRETVEGSDAEYAFVPCDASLADTPAFCRAYGYSLDDSANCILVATVGMTETAGRRRREG